MKRRLRFRPLHLHLHLRQGFRIPWVLALICAVGLTACTNFRPIDPNRPVELSLGEGLLILDIDTEIPLRLLRTSRGRMKDVEAGRHVWIVRLGRGRHIWREIQIDIPGRQKGYYRYRVSRDPEFEFEIEAGKINYPGQLVIRRYRGAEHVPSGLVIRNVNRAGMTLRALRKSHPEILRQFELVQSGSSEDGFLEHYSRVVGELVEAAKPEDAHGDDQ